MTGEDVRALQQYLNVHGDMVSASGGGTLGKETYYFGVFTYWALVGFQNAHAEAFVSPGANRRIARRHRPLRLCVPRSVGVA